MVAEREVGTTKRQVIVSAQRTHWKDVLKRDSSRREFREIRRPGDGWRATHLYGTQSQSAIPRCASVLLFPFGVFLGALFPSLALAVAAEAQAKGTKTRETRGIDFIVAIDTINTINTINKKGEHAPLFC